MPSGEDQQGRRSTDRPASQQQNGGAIHFGPGSNFQVIVQSSTDRPGHQQSVSNNEAPGEGLPATPAPEESLPTGWKWFFGISGVLITYYALPLFVNLSTGQPPPWQQKIAPYSTPLIVGSLALLGVLYLWKTRLQNLRTKMPGQARRDRIEIPSRATLLTKSRNIHKESEEAFERAVDVTLGIQRVPQLVRAQYLSHTTSRGSAAAHQLNEPIVDYLLRVEKLLLVGAPGAGKTETLRTVWGELLERTQADPSFPVPFLVNLSTFSQYPGSFRDWLAESLRDCAGIPVSIGQVLLQRGQLFLLLDGLDEMAESRRTVALIELNELLAKADPALGRCVVCSRTLEYEQTGVALCLPAALELQPLTAEQVQDAVAKAGPAAQPLATALEHDPALPELLGTPLLLTIAARTFAGNPGLVIAGQGPVELRQTLFDAYIAQMLRRSHMGTAKPSLHLLRCLHWLAQYMASAQSTLFLMERLQPTVLRMKWLYKLATGLVFGLVFVFGLAGRLDFWLLGGLLGGLLLGLDLDKIQPVEQMRWSWAWRQESWRWKTFLHKLLLIGLLGGLFFGLPLGLHFGPLIGLVSWLFNWLLTGLGELGLQGWAKSLSKQSIRPNQGIHSSIRNGLTEGMTTGLVFGLLVGGLVIGLGGGLGGGLVIGLGGGLVGGLVIGLGGGRVFKRVGGLGEALKALCAARSPLVRSWLAAAVRVVA